MDTQKQNKLITIIWCEVENLIKYWQENPFEYNLEIDIQTDLVNRIKEAFKKIGEDKLMQLCYKTRVKGFENGANYSRICCEWLTYYEWNDTKRYKCYPDIIVFKDVPDKEHPLDEKPESNLPMLWACEIKYKTEWGGSIVAKKDNWDIDKMRCLLTQKPDGVEFGCRLNMSRERSKSGHGFDLHKDHNDRLWEYDIKLP